MSLSKIHVDRFDKEWSRLVRERDGRCVVCGNPGPLDAHHFIRRGIAPVRLDLENGISLCKSHHVFNHEFSAHKTPSEFKNWFRKKWPTRAKILQDKANAYMSKNQAIQKFCTDYLYQLTPALYKLVMKQKIKAESTSIDPE